jgi:hypothetical protein
MPTIYAVRQCIHVSSLALALLLKFALQFRDSHFNLDGGNQLVRNLNNICSSTKGGVGLR